MITEDQLTEWERLAADVAVYPASTSSRTLCAAVPILCAELREARAASAISAQQARYWQQQCEDARVERDSQAEFGKRMEAHYDRTETARQAAEAQRDALLKIAAEAERFLSAIDDWNHGDMHGNRTAILRIETALRKAIDAIRPPAATPAPEGKP